MTPRPDLARAIEEYEYLRHSAGGRLCGVYVRATRVRTALGKVTANVTVTDPGGIRTAYPDCEYDIGAITATLDGTPDRGKRDPQNPLNP